MCNNNISYQLHRFYYKIKLYFDEMYTGTDEFHPSFDMNASAMYYMTEQERTEYLNRLIKRREILHNIDNEW